MNMPIEGHRQTAECKKRKELKARAGLCLSVRLTVCPCLLFTSVSRDKTAEPTEMYLDYGLVIVIIIIMQRLTRRVSIIRTMNRRRPQRLYHKTVSHRHARQDKTALSVSRPLRRCELDSRQLKIVADWKFEV